MKRSTLMITMALFLLCSNAWAQKGATQETKIAPKKEAVIRELLAVTKASEMGTQVMSAMIDSFSVSMPDVPQKFWTRFMEKVDPRDLENLIVPIYDRHFTLKELQALVAFYKTPEGTSVITKMPVVMQESMMAGQKWGEILGQMVVDELQREGYREAL